MIIDPLSDVPFFKQVHDHIIADIARGQYKPGDALPSVRQLAGEAHITPATVVKAYKLLAENGLLITKDRSGCYVVIPSRKKARALVERELEPVKTLARAVGVDLADLIGKS